MKRLLTTLAIFGLLGIGSAYAQTIAYDDPSNQGAQARGGNLGLLFQVNSPIPVTSLGVFNASGSGTISGTINLTAMFYDDNGNPEGSPQTISLAGNGHTSFLLSSQYAFIANAKGVMKVSGGPLMGLGLRASPYGTLTSIPLPLQ
jgi:hypothetical protein